MKSILFSLLILGAPADTVTEPFSRWGHVFVYDAARQELLLFGGAPARGEYAADTWTWRNGSWTEHHGPGPSARGFAGAAYDPVRGVVVVHGGRGPGNVTHTDTWTWNGTEWTRVAADSGWQADHHVIVWDPERLQLVGFGGWTGSTVGGETRLWDGVSWTAVPVAGPPARAAFGMSWDGSRSAVVLYGGLWINGQYADTWRWDGHTWEALTGPYDNSSLDHHSMAWDPDRRQLLLFGGKDYRREMNHRTRVLDGVSWTEVAAAGPEARHSVPIAWHAGRQTTMLFGGKRYEGADHVPLGGLWEWDGEEWRPVE